MKSIIYQRYGAVEVLELADEPVPIQKDNEVLVKIKSVSLNPLDWKIRNGELKIITGNKFPKHICCEFSGVVEKVGTRVSSFQPGEKVFGFVKPMKEGSLREYLAVGEDSLIHKPQNISFEQAASVSITGIAALQALKNLANAEKGQSILLNGCTGGVGMFAIQIAKQLGLNVTGVCSATTASHARNWGCDTVLDYKKINILNLTDRFDIILDLSAKLTFKKAKTIMKDKSIFIDPIALPTKMIAAFFYNIFSSKKHKILFTKYTKNDLQYLTKMIEAGMKIEVSKTYKISDFKTAFSELEKGGILGKVVINI